MGNNVRTFEIRVEVNRKGSRHFSSHVGKYIESKIVRMFHVDARTHKQALSKVEKHGRPIHACKAKVDKMAFNVETLLQGEPYGLDNPYSDAIAMEEFIWKKKNRRADRIANKRKDKT